MNRIFKVDSKIEREFKKEKEMLCKVFFYNRFTTSSSLSQRQQLNQAERPTVSSSYLASEVEQHWA